MALKVGELFATLALDSGGFNKGLDSAGRKLSSLGGNITSVGAGMTAMVSAPLVALGVGAIKSAGDFEQAQIAFTSMLGSATAATGFLNELRDFAARTPFEFPDLVKSSRMLLAFGFQAKEVVPMMTSIGDAVSALGGGAFEIDRVTRAIGQMRAKGKVSAEEMMQLAEIGIPAWEMLAKKMGTDIPTAMKQAETGGVSAGVGISAILEGMEGRFKGMMGKQSETLLGRLSTLKDEVTKALQDVGKALMPFVKPLIEWLMIAAQWVGKLAEWFGKLPKPVQGVALAFGLLLVAVGPLLMGLGFLATNIGSILSLAAVAPGFIAAMAGGLTAALPIIAVVTAAFVALGLAMLTVNEAMKWWEAHKQAKQSKMETEAFEKEAADYIKRNDRSVRKRVEAEAEATRRAQAGNTALTPEAQTLKRIEELGKQQVDALKKMTKTPALGVSS